MSHPAYLIIGKVTCLATDDLTGNDQLVGVMGNDRFMIGEFNAGDSRDVGINRNVPVGVTELVVLETDAIDPDDELARIDLLTDMDVARTVGIVGDSARYDIELTVTGQSDG